MSGTDPNTKKLRRRTIRFLNTVEPVISLYRILGESLVAAGYDVEIVVSSGQYRNGGTALSEWARVAGVDLVLLPGVASYPRRGPLKILVAVYYAIFALIYTLVAKPAAVNVFLTQPPMFFTWGMLLKLIRRQPYVCIIMDLYPEILAAYGNLSPTSMIYGLFSRLARGALKKADAVVCIGRCMCDRLRQGGVTTDTVRLIPNWAEPFVLNPDAISGNAKQMTMDDLALMGKFVVLYSGNMGVAHSFDELLDAAVYLRNHKRIFFLIIGEGARRDAVTTRIQTHGLSNVRVMPYQDGDKAASIMAAADVHLVTQQAGFEGLVVPSKAYSSLAAGKPLIYVGCPNGEIARMIVENSVGIVVPPGHASALVNACIRLETDPTERTLMGARSRVLATERYSRSRAARDYTELLAGIADNRAR